MSRMTKFAIAILVVALLLKLDHWHIETKEKRILGAVQAIGGRFGSIPAWPLGTEYRIVLSAVPNAEQLEDLTTANHMRGWVGIAFEDCEVAAEEVLRLKASLPACDLFVVGEEETLQPLTAKIASVDL